MVGVCVAACVWVCVCAIGWILFFEPQWPCQWYEFHLFDYSTLPHATPCMWMNCWYRDSQHIIIIILIKWWNAKKIATQSKGTEWVDGLNGFGILNSVACKAERNGNQTVTEKKAREEEAPSKIQRLFLFRCGGVDGNGGWCRKSKTERKKRKKKRERRKSLAYQP